MRFALRGAGLLGLGAAAALGQPPVSLWPVTLIALAVMFVLMRQAETPRRAALGLWLFAVAYFAVALRWIVEPFQVEAEIFGWMAPFALMLMAGGLALFWAGAGWLGHRLGGSAALVVSLAVAELARAHILTGFPWGGLAQIWVGTPVAQGLAWIGPQGLGVLTLGVAALPSIPRQNRLRIGLSLPGIALAGIALSPDVAATPEPDDRPIIRIVQPNAPQRDKWDPEKWETFFWRQVEATGAETPPDLVIWPETAIPQLLEHAEEALSIVAEAARGAPVVLGMQRRDAEFRYYNALITLDDRGAVDQTYDKHHLVPFGEYMPFPALFRRLGITALAQRAEAGYARGPGPRVIEVAGLRALPLICYEAVFPQHARAPGARPDVLLQITNDAWFGDYAGPQQHLAQARMRAIEQGLPLVRSANTGISAMIDPRGRILAALPLGTHGFVDAALPKPLPATLYARSGEWPVTIMLLIGLVTLALRRKHPFND